MIYEFFKLSGTLNVSGAIVDQEEFIKRFTQLLKDLNITFEGKLDPIEAAEQDPKVKGVLS